MSFARLYLAIPSLALLLTSAACSRDSDNDPLAADSSLLRDLTLAQQAGQQPAMSDEPAQVTTPTPQLPRQQSSERPAPQKAPPPVAPPVQDRREPEVIPLTPVPAPTSGAIDAGSHLMAALRQQVCTNGKVGDRVTAAMTEEVRGSNGVALPVGSVLTLEVASVTQPSDSMPRGAMTFRVVSVEATGRSHSVLAAAVPVDTLVRVRTTETRNDVRKVAGGAIAGAILGQILGKDTRSTVIGAAAGAAAGTAVAVATGEFSGCVPVEGVLKATLTEALVLPIGS